MNWVSENYLSGKGRSGRLTFLGCIVAGYVVAAAAIALLLLADRGTARLLAWAIVFFATLGPTVRRLHDVNAGGGFAAVLLLPLAGWLLLLALLLIPGTPGPNRWGNPPR